MNAVSTLSPTSRYAASALLALALHGSQFRHEADGKDFELWTHESHGLLRPVFRFLDVDERAWTGLEETAANSAAEDHVGAYLRIIFEDENSTEESELELALAKAVDAMEMTLVSSLSSQGLLVQKHIKQEQECEDKIFSQAKDEIFDATLNPNQTFASESSSSSRQEKSALNSSVHLCAESFIVGDTSSSYQRKVLLLYVLLSACVADVPEDDKKASKFRKGYDARHRVALRLLATWLDIRWSKVEAMEIMIACSALAASKAEAQSQESEPEQNKWSKWKRGGIIGAAALTGGALLAITGGLAAPAIAAGFGALAPTLGTIVPFVGAGGFAAMASAAGSVAGSVAVAASFGAAGAGLSGSKMARRIGGIKEFEFKPIGDNHNQGRLAVGILISGFVFEEEDFVRPWKGWEDNLERYILQWESKNLITVSTAIQDWLTSSLTMELMRQGAMMTVLSTLVYALAWPAALLSATNFIDSKWSIAINRSDKAGKLLAEVLLKGLQGNRPVTLIGFSLGARVIFKCLQKLAESGSNEGLVERVVLLGAPVSVQGERWDLARKLVAGRFINVYSTNDWILGVTFRASLLTQGLAGIQPVNVPGVENVDVTSMVDGHSSYLWSVQQILEKLELDSFQSVSSHHVVI